jgi:hypothetical protein
LVSRQINQLGRYTSPADAGIPYFRAPRMFDWEQILLNGRLDLALLDLTLSMPDGTKHEGSGRLSWNADRQLVFDAVTAGERDIFDLHLANTDKPGTIIPPDQFYNLSASTNDGWMVEASNIYETEVTFPSIAPYITWKHSLKNATLTRDDDVSPEPAAQLRTILGPVSNVKFGRRSETRDDNPIFGSRVGKPDWLQFETAFGQVSARRIGGNHVQLFIAGEHTFDGLCDALESTRLALSYLEGRSLELYGFEAICAGKRYRRLFSCGKASQASFAPPLSGIAEGHERLLRYAANFFHSERGKSFAHYLRMCWDVNDNRGTVRAILAATTVEAMVMFLAQTGTHVHDTEDQKNACQRLIACLTKRRSRYGDNFVNRLTGMNLVSDPINVTKALNAWLKNGWLGIHKQEVDAWKSVRNASTHGKLLFLETSLDKRQKSVNRLYSVQNLVNKLNLQAMEYEGQFFDYSTWSDSQFTPSVIC